MVRFQGSSECVARWKGQAAGPEPRQTLTKKRNGMHTTPAMAAGLTNRVLTVHDLLDLLDGR